MDYVGCWWYTTLAAADKASWVAWRNSFASEPDPPPDPPIIPSPAQYATITWLNSTGGSIYPTGVGYSSVSYLVGTEVTMTAYPIEPLYAFSHWLLDGVEWTVATNPYTWTISTGWADTTKTIQPVFTYTAPTVPTGADWTLTVYNSRDGTTNPAVGVYTLTDLDKIVTAYPFADYRFSWWVVDGNSTETDNPYTLTSALGESHTVEPVYMLDVQGGQSEVVNIPEGTPVVFGDTSMDELKAIVEGVDELDLEEILGDLEIDF